MKGSICTHNQKMEICDEENNNSSFGAIGQGRPITKSLSSQHAPGNSLFQQQIIDSITQHGNLQRLPFEAYQQDSPYHTVPQPGYHTASPRWPALQDLFINVTQHSQPSAPQGFYPPKQHVKHLHNLTPHHAQQEIVVSFPE